MQGGGAERVFSDLASALARRGHDVHVFSFDQPGTEPFYPISFETFGSRADLLNIRRSLKGHDAVIAFMHSAYIPVCVALADSGVPVIASEHTAFPYYRGKPFQRALLHLAPLLSKAITIPSAGARESFPLDIRSKMLVVPNPVSTPRRKADVRAGKVLLAVGSLEPVKNHKALIQAFLELETDWTLRIVGEGSLRPELEAMGGRVELPGATKDIAREYERAQLFAMPSIYESFGLATAEALAHGLPVIGMRSCTGTNELVRHGQNGLLVSDLKPALRLLMEDENERVRLSKGLMEDYSLESVCDAWERVLCRAVGQFQRPAANAAS